MLVTGTFIQKFHFLLITFLYSGNNDSLPSTIQQLKSLRVAQHTGLFIIGIIFSAIGIGGLLLARVKRGLFWLFLLLGISSLLLTTIGPLSNSQENIDQLLSMDSQEIQMIEVRPTSRTYPSLVEKIMIIHNRQSIDNICLALNHAREVDDDFLKAPDSCCSIIVTMTDRSTIQFGMMQRGQVTGIDVGGESGWHYGRLEANDFGKVLKSLIHNTLLR